MSRFTRRPSSSNSEIFKFEKPGDTLIGVYLAREDYHAPPMAPTFKHTFRLESGKFMVVFGSKVLNDELIKNYRFGQMLEVVYTHSDPSKTRGYHPTKKFSIGVDESFKLSAEDAAFYAVEATSGSPAPGIDEDLDEPSEEGEDEPRADERPTAAVKPRPAAAAPSSDRIAKVAAAISGRRI